MWEVIIQSLLENWGKYHEIGNNLSLTNFSSLSYKIKSRDSSVGIELGYGLDEQGSKVRLLVGLGIFLFNAMSRMALGPT